MEFRRCTAAMADAIAGPPPPAAPSPSALTPHPPIPRPAPAPRRRELERRCELKAARVDALETERRAMAGALQALRRDVAAYEVQFRQELSARRGPTPCEPLPLKSAPRGAAGKAGGSLGGSEGGGTSPRIRAYASPLQLHGPEEGMAYATEALRALLAAEERREAEREELFAGARSEWDRQTLAELFRREQDQVAQVAAGLASQMGRLGLEA